VGGAEAIMKVLVTGGGGFLGSAICRQLLARGDSVVSLQRSAPQAPAAANLKWLRGDISRSEDLLKAAQNCDAVIHTAAKAGIWGSEAEYHSVNVTGTDNVIKACRTNGIQLLVHTSSPSVVHAGGDIEGGDESLPLGTHFNAAYPRTKAQAETRVLAASDKELLTTALRPHLIWGPGDPHLLPRLVKKVRRGRLALPGAEKCIDTVFVDNAARAHLDALDELAGAARCAGKAYFISNGEPLPQADIIRRLLAAVDIDVRIQGVPPALARLAGALCEFSWKTLRLDSEPPVTRFAVEQLSTAHWFDITAAQRDFGYQPAISIDQGLAILAKAHRSGTALV
jgi:nucleoside-diphosphate-sugar epimerase